MKPTISTNRKLRSTIFQPIRLSKSAPKQPQSELKPYSVTYILKVRNPANNPRHSNRLTFSRYRITRAIARAISTTGSTETTGIIIQSGKWGVCPSISIIGPGSITFPIPDTTRTKAMIYLATFATVEIFLLFNNSAFLLKAYFSKLRTMRKSISLIFHRVKYFLYLFFISVHFSIFHSAYQIQRLCYCKKEPRRIMRVPQRPLSWNDSFDSYYLIEITLGRFHQNLHFIKYS